MRADPPPLSFFHARSKPTADGAHYLGAAVDDGGRTFDGAGMEALPRVWLFCEQENLLFVRALGGGGGAKGRAGLFLLRLLFRAF